LIGLTVFFAFTFIAGGFFLSCTYDPATGADPVRSTEEGTERID